LLTYEDMTSFFLKAAQDLSLVTHPEYWLNTRSLEREFACTCHTGTCEDAELQSSCTIAFTWGSLDTALSLEGPAGVCEFFHDADEDCPHLHTETIPPLILDLSYSLPLNGVMLSEDALLSLTQVLRLRASEHSLRTTETRPGVNVVLHENRLRPETLTLQQRVEIPLWHPLGIHGLHDDPQPPRRRHLTLGSEVAESLSSEPDEPHPEDWLPQVMLEVAQDIVHVLAALDTTLSYHSSER
jgi:hypothetical protein